MEYVVDRIRALLEIKPCVIVAIEGGSAGGKTTLAARLQKELDANVFHMDDFFLHPCKRIPPKPKAPDFKKYDQEDYSL